MNTKYVLALFAALLVLPLVHAALVSPSLEPTLLRYEPVPAKPGDTVDVWIQINNDGDQAAQNVQLLVNEGYPFTITSAAQSTINIGTIPAKNSFVTKITVAVDRNAPDGVFSLSVRTRQGTANSETTDIPIEIRSSAASLRVVSATATPEQLAPGAVGAVAVRVENIEDTLMRDLTITLDLSNSVFAPLGSTNQQKVARLEGGEEYTFNFKLITEPDAASSVYRIPANFTFTTNNGTRFTQQETIGLVVSAKPELAALIDEVNVYKGDEEGTVLVRLVNKGLAEVKFVNVELQDSEQYASSGATKTSYVGNIDSDDFETAEFTIKPKADDFNLALHVEYRDALNNNYEENFSVPVHLQKKADEGSNKWLLIVLAVVVIGAIVLWRRRSAKKR